MLKRKMSFIAVSLLIFVGCPYIDHGVTYAPDGVVASVDEIRGCFYREQVNSLDWLVCEELCVDSVAHFLYREYGKNDDGKYVNLKKDTSFFSEVELREPQRDGSFNSEIFIKGVGAFNYYKDSSSKTLAADYYQGNGDAYSTTGWTQCAY